MVDTTSDELEKTSLRYALTYARDGDTIQFDPDVFPPGAPATIQHTTALPQIGQGNLTIDGSNAGVILDGSLLPAGTDGLVLVSDSNTVTGLWIQDMPDDGISVLGNNNAIGGSIGVTGERAAAVGVSGPPVVPDMVISGNAGHGIEIQGNGNVVQGCYIGTDAAGMAAVGNSRNGIHMSNGAQGNQVGGSVAGQGNLISGNQLVGIQLRDNKTEQNRIEGNYIGSNITGIVPLGNQDRGVSIINQAQHNHIGGEDKFAGNLISGHSQAGVEILNAYFNSVIGNIIGPNITGRMPMGNATGVLLSSTYENLIHGNLISANNGNGLYIYSGSENTITGNKIGTDSTGDMALPNQQNGIYLTSGARDNIIGGETGTDGNLISGNTLNGIRMAADTGSPPHHNTIQGNKIGTNLAGDAALPNGPGGNAGGIYLMEGSHENLIGGISSGSGSCAGPCNLISGNGQDGVRVDGAGWGNTIAGNFVGANVAGDAALGNAVVGIGLLRGAHENLVGGGADAGNLISGNGSTGVSIFDGSSNNTIAGNFIGANATGDAALGNGGAGVSISDADGNVIGGAAGTSCSATCNLISGNANSGISITGADSYSNSVYGNFIGVNKGGDAAIPNDDSGVLIGFGAHSNQIGLPNNGNVLSGNELAGVLLMGADTNKNNVIGNIIGLDASSSTSLPNFYGVYLLDGPQENRVGGSGMNEANIIAGNSSHGVVLTEEDTANNVIERNYIGANEFSAGYLGNGGAGVILTSGAHHNVIGQEDPRHGFGNIIIHNLGDGVAISNYAHHNQVTGNYIGGTVGGWAAGNFGHGVYIYLGANNNQVGGTSSFGDLGNTITANRGDGVRVNEGGSIGNTITRNSIYDNIWMGIKLNDGGNMEFPPPTISDFGWDNAVVLYKIEGSTCANCTVEVYSDAEDEGKYYEDSLVAAADGAFTVWVTRHARNFTLTATDLSGNTSEFSEPLERLWARLVATHLEVTQVIQTLDPNEDEVPLVADKRTYVRFHVRSDTGQSEPDVTARLNAFRDGVQLEPHNLRPANPARTITVQTNPDRGQLQHSFFFRVPDEWRSGTVTFQAEVNPEVAIPEGNLDDNIITRRVTFHSQDPLCVGMVRVRTSPRTASVNDPGFWDIIGWLRAAYPVPRVRVYNMHHTVEEIQTCWKEVCAPPFDWPCVDIPYPCYGPYEMPDDSSKVLRSLFVFNTFTDDPDECDSQLYYFGMVHPRHGAGSGGAGYLDGDEAWGFMNLTDVGTGAAWYPPHGGVTMAHEIGHNLNRKHVNCGGPDNVDGGYPYNGCDIGPNNASSYYGFKADDEAVIPPTEAGDLMSYAHNVGKPRWPSDYTYRALYNRLPGLSALRASARIPEQLAQAQELLIATGIITPAEGTATLDSFYRLPQGTLSAANVARAAERQAVVASDATYKLRLLDEADGVLADQPFQLPTVMDSEGPDNPFMVVMPYHSDTARIVLLRDSVELASRAVSPHAPSVHLISPNGGETITDTLTIQWEAEDEDDVEDDVELILYTVQYSSDQGETWKTLTTDQVTTTFTLETETQPTTTLTLHRHMTLTLEADGLPGSQGQALIRVIGTDGVNTAIDQSDYPFTLEAHPPLVYIVEPADGVLIEPDSMIFLSAFSIDAEDGPLANDAYVWTSDRDGYLGTGDEILVSDLSRGWHQISVIGTDSDGSSATDTIQVFVGHRVHLPLILKKSLSSRDTGRYTRYPCKPVSYQ